MHSLTDSAPLLPLFGKLERHMFTDRCAPHALFPHLCPTDELSSTRFEPQPETRPGLCSPDPCGFRMPATGSESMKAGNHTFAITNKPLTLALFKRPDRGQEFSSIDGLLQPGRGSQTLSPMSMSNTTSAKVRITTVSTGPIRQHRVNTKPGNQSRFFGRKWKSDCHDRNKKTT
eukprot:5104141-Amphidinium_carterae.1